MKLLNRIIYVFTLGFMAPGLQADSAADFASLEVNLNQLFENGGEFIKDALKKQGQALIDAAQAQLIQLLQFLNDNKLAGYRTTGGTSTQVATYQFNALNDQEPVDPEKKTGFIDTVNSYKEALEKAVDQLDRFRENNAALLINLGLEDYNNEIGSELGFFEALIDAIDSQLFDIIENYPVIQEQEEAQAQYVFAGFGTIEAQTPEKDDTAAQLKTKWEARNKDDYRANKLDTEEAVKRAANTLYALGQAMILANDNSLEGSLVGVKGAINGLAKSDFLTEEDKEKLLNFEKLSSSS